VTYYGIDRDTSIVAVEERPRRTFIEADLQTWQPPFEFDVAVGFETIEHLENYGTYLDWVRRARRYGSVALVFARSGVTPVDRSELRPTGEPRGTLRLPSWVRKRRGAP
jgi:cyclopropane fatty-acyl-phospholipid synthase-like methyltransferase